MPAISASPVRPLGKVARSRLILSGTSAFVSAVLLVWLLVAPTFGPRRRAPRLLTGSFSAPEALTGAAAAMAEDVRRLSGQGRAGVGARDWGKAVEEVVARGGDPVVIYLAAVGVSAPSDREGTRAFVLTDDVPFGPKRSLTSAADLLALLRKNSGVPKLLILDAGRLGSDRELGVFGNGFLNQLAPLLRRDGNLAVLTSCAPGQISWPSEGRQRSIFARSVAEGLSGKASRWGQVTVQGLYRYVASDVSRWASTNRDGALQTPLILGNDSLDFPIPRLTIPTTHDRPDTVTRTATIREELKRGWEERAALSGLSPYFHAPVAWVRYQNALLSAERLARAGDAEGAGKALGTARDLKARIESLATGPSLTRPHSLVLAEARAKAGAPNDDVVAYRQAIEQAVSGTTDDGGDDAPPPPAVSPPKEPPPAPSVEGEKPATKDAEGAPKAAPVVKPSAAVATRAEEKPAKPVARPPAALTKLTGNSPEGPPTFVEGQLPLWYARFVAAGGETELLRPTRLGLLRRAIAVRSRAEQASAGSPSSLGVRALVDEGDRYRRQAQDRIFAAEPSLLKDSDAQLVRAQSSYDKAVVTAGQLASAYGLVARLQDELPYYGEWQSSRPDGMDEAFIDLLSAAADLAKLVDDGPGSDREKKEGDDGWGDRTQKLADRLESALAQLTSDFRKAVDRATEKTSTAGWRELDALLRVPTVAADDRLLILDRLAAPESSGGTEAGSGVASDAEADPGFWKRARDLARLEWGLLKLGGLDVTDLAELQGQAWTYREKNPALAFDALDRFSSRVRELRSSVASEGHRGADRAPGEQANRTVAEALKKLTTSDRSVRALPASALADFTEDPARKLDEFRLHALLVWHAARLNNDFEPGHAARLLDDARQFAGSKDLWEERVKSQQLLEAQLVVKTDAIDPLRQGVTVLVSSEGEVPRGEATLLNAHNPSVPLDGIVSGGGSLIPVPTESDKPVSRTLSLSPAAARLAPAGRVLVPEAFYRGRRFAAEGVALPDQEKLVKVELRQQRLLPKHPDQFIEHPAKGYLRTRTSLDYKLLITNLTDRPLNAVVTYGLEGEVAETGKVRFSGNATSDVLKGTLESFDLPDDSKSRLLVVSVNEDSPEGRPLCEPLKVPFRKVHPKEFIVAEPGHGGGEFFVHINHLKGPDPIPLPVPVTVKVEPANAFREVRNSMVIVERGGVRTVRFQVVNPVKKVKWTVSAEGVPDVVVGEFVFEE